jgi:hypothetical protein
MVLHAATGDLESVRVFGEGLEREKAADCVGKVHSKTISLGVRKF